MASACLPLLFRAVEIDGVPYWDGGYLANPVIFPFFGTTTTEDVLVVQINPLVRTSNADLGQRDHEPNNEITFNSSLLAEYRAIEFVGRLIDQGRLPHGVGPASIVASTFIAFCSISRHQLRCLQQIDDRLRFFSRRCMSTVSAPPAGSSMTILTTSA